ncbi:hypothetical protein M2322_004802 [Rhodoblastus acidophilus]|uniref:hypothetical protein n=1 Tax=Rhodoblastus acidophilus TaxID=1074 RepID=UPI0022259FB1|nr:hypothetical protein [Rhodoblastus acidophilus]MCW2319233.1 hypothetical protein [Rhodoblastus acidophilus]
MTAHAEIVVLRVDFDNAGDIAHCLTALSRAEPAFDIFVCESGGRAFYNSRIVCLARRGRRRAPEPFFDTTRMRHAARPARVNIGWAQDDPRDAAGVNARLHPLLQRLGWKGVWFPNTYADRELGALAALTAGAEGAGKSAVSSALLDVGLREAARFLGRGQWRRLSSHSVAFGKVGRLDAPVDFDASERAMNSLSGASMYMYMTRRGIEQSGGALSLSRLSAGLHRRNALHLVGRHFPSTPPLNVAVSLAYALPLLRVALRNVFAALEGLLTDLRGARRRPAWIEDGQGGACSSGESGDVTCKLHSMCSCRCP